MGDLAWNTLKACNVAKLKVSDKRYVLEAEKLLENALKLTEAQRIEKAEAKLAKAKSACRSKKTDKESDLVKKAREKLERLTKSFEDENKRSIAKRRLYVKEEKKVLNMR